MRIGPDVEASWGGLQPAARTTGLRSFYQRSAWLSDPDCLIVRPPLSLGEAQAWASLVALSGGLTLFSDHLPKLPPERLAILPRTLPAAPVAGRPIDTAQVDRTVAPALVAGGRAIPISGPWRFRTGDDPAYGTREFDEAAWETIAVPRLWGDAGHPDYAGVAWYRTRLVLPNQGELTSGPGGVYLELGKIADADETFMNGVKIGQTGDVSPSPRGERQAYRRYRLAPGSVNWGGENVLAVRVWGGARGAGGVWNVERDGPPRTWVVEGAPGWWTVVVANWEDEPQAVSLPLAALGLTGVKFTAYDVWRDTALPDLADTLRVTLEPRSARTVALRAVAARPQVIGTTRHVVQGAIDITDEAWDVASRTLSAKSINLDSRAYAVTLAVPKRLRPARCQANVPCNMRRLETGQVVLTWPAGGDGRDITWELTFRPAAQPGRR
jgi:hypothetical protein